MSSISDSVLFPLAPGRAARTPCQGRHSAPAVTQAGVLKVRRYAANLTPPRGTQPALRTARAGRTAMTSPTVRLTTWRLFVAGLLLALLAAAPARAVCVTDELGADDVPGQKDLNEWCEPGPTCSSSSATASLRWQLDYLIWSGNNTGDSCAPIDTNR